MMSTPSYIPVAEYLATSYRPDCDYVDGEVQERTGGEHDHSLLQCIIATLFHNHWRAWRIVPLIAVRVQVSPTRFRVPDICILHSSDPAEAIVRNAPWICIEILSAEDRLQRVQERVDDYMQMGVGYVWVIDPKTRNAYVASTNGFLKTSNGEFAVEGTPIRVSLAEVFAEFDEIQGQAKS
jgi:Uma2 family endonuclease